MNAVDRLLGGGRLSNYENIQGDFSYLNILKMAELHNRDAFMLESWKNGFKEGARASSIVCAGTRSKI